MGTFDLGIYIGGMGITLLNLGLHAYADAAFADRELTRHSTGGHIVFAAGAPLHWKTKRQTIVALSSTEAEFMNLTPTGMALIWVHNMLAEVGHKQKIPTLLYTDSQNARHIALNPLQMARTRHIDLRYKWIIEKVTGGFFNLGHVGTADMAADGLTKPLQREKHRQFVKQLGLYAPGT